MIGDPISEPGPPTVPVAVVVDVVPVFTIVFAASGIAKFKAAVLTSEYNFVFFW